MSKLFKGIIAGLCIFAVSSVFSADQPDVLILYPKDKSLAGNRVNLVLDPTDIPYFQVVVNKTEYPVVDTSTGAHAYQGLALLQGPNVITVNVLAPDDKEKKKLTIVASRSVRVFNGDGAFSPVPRDFTQENFHTRERESTCGTCHRLEITQQDQKHAKPGDVLCYTCHRQIPMGRHIHGPAAVWNCLACHNPDLYPAKYAFSSLDPWKIAKSTRSVEPVVFTLSSAALFKPASAVLISKEKTKEALSETLQYLKQNPGDKVRLEVHTDNVPLKRQKTKKGKLTGFKDNQALTDARAKTLASLLKESGVGKKKILAVGMGQKLPKAANETREGREINNRIEAVIYPSDIKVANSQKLPVLKDRERVVVNIVYSHGALVKKLRIVEQVPKGMQYLKGSGFFRGKTLDPKISGKQLVWDLGDIDSNFSETLFYIFKKEKGAGDVPPETKIVYRAYDRELSRGFDPKAPSQRGSTVMETCLKCHAGIVGKKFKHGPVDAGYCNLCHDPHASDNAAWLRKPTWDLCTTCHAEKGRGVHVVAGFVTGNSHPAKNHRDPARPGKRLSCASCHDPHSAETGDLLAYNAKTRAELCSMCHKK